MKDLIEISNYYMESKYDLLNEAEDQYISILNKYYLKRTGEKYPNPNESPEVMQQKIVDIASEMGFDVPGKNLKVQANNAKRLIVANLKNVKPESEEQKGKIKTSLTTSGASDKPSEEDVSLKQFPKYEDFRKKYYKSTVSLGWPSDIKDPNLKDYETDGGIVYPWSKLSKSAFVFNKRGQGLVSFRNYTKKIQNYLYTKFENDVQGLKKLMEKVDSILDIEKQYLRKKKPVSIIGTLLINIFKGIGGTEADEKMLQFLMSKAQGMTIFEYQKYILDEMFTKMSVGDDVSKTLKNILFPLYKQVKSTCEKYFIIEPVKFEDRDIRDSDYQAYFNVKVRAGTKDSQYSKSYSPFVYVLENNVIPLLEGKNIGSKSGRKMESEVDVEDIKGLIKALKTSDEEKTSSIIDKSPDISLIYDALDEDNKLIGKYYISFDYFTKGCRITIGFDSEKTK